MSYIKLRVIGISGEKDQQEQQQNEEGAEFRQTINSVKNYEKVHKFNRYEFRPQPNPVFNNESPNIPQGSPPFVRPEEINSSIERLQING